MENSWPYFHIDSMSPNDKEVIWCGSRICTLLPWKDLSEVFLNKNVFVLATGPSICELDLNGLHHHGPIVGVNGAIAIQDSSDVQFSAYFIVDRGFIERRFEMFERVVSQKIPCFLTFDCIFEVCKRRPDLLKEASIFLIENYNERYGVGRKNSSDLARAMETDDGLEVLGSVNGCVGFSHDPERGVYDGATVVHWALQVLVNYRVSEVAILGMDMGSKGGSHRFYEGQARAEHSSLDDNFEATILPSFQLASKVCQQLSINVVNLSPYSRLPSDVFNKKSFEEYMGEKYAI
ncbi:hypothetical protein BTA51_00525 [Hahella sp. CCB-MM4]|uniref:hypothetical protein n=1 Tax=Hahella sp. (strain CCB-MM4) TaxID=1926491 RepID=UPI000B9AD40D|nr:hypothetical protein [Hahella sp. CCB-MM4]OZG74924.1 hypothetical protein BTA51_00525 [Hahella sp. CCB-MM4]